MKRCNSCGVSKPPTAFTKQKQRNGGYRLMSECKQCATHRQKIRYQHLTEDQKLRNKDRFMRRKYGITIEQYNEMFAKQNGKCANDLCGKHQSEITKSLVVDHCHVTNKVRGLLCAGCNLALGNTYESAARLEGLAKYIRGHQ